MMTSKLIMSLSTLLSRASDHGHTCTLQSAQVCRSQANSVTLRAGCSDGNVDSMLVVGVSVEEED